MLEERSADLSRAPATPLTDRALRAHEMKNCLAVIYAIARILEKDVPARLHCRIDRLSNAVRRVNEMIDDDLAGEGRRLDAGETTTITNQEILRRVRERVEDCAAFGRVLLTMKADDGAFTGETGDFVEALANLVGNAIKASASAGQVSLVTARQLDGSTEWTVEDLGCGMTAEQISSFGKPFCTAFEGGTGVGAAFVLEVCERLGTALEVSSTLGRGTRVTLRVPAPKEGK